MIISTPSYATFHLGSNSGGAVSSRQYYSNLLRLIRTPDQRNRNVTLFAFEFTKQSVKVLVPTPQGGLDVAVTPDYQLIMKYDYHR
jgi:hypothetical protein